MKKFYYQLLSAFIFFIFNNVYSQNIQWAQNMGENLGYARGNSIANDKFNNIYTVGSFSNLGFDIDFGVDTSLLGYSGGDDIFILKNNTYGEFLWAKGIGGKRREKASSVSVDDSGNVYITGTFEDTVDFNPGVNTNILTAIGTNIFVLKLNTNGDFVWVKNIPTTLINNNPSIKISNDGSVIVSGDFSGNPDFDPGSGVFNLGTSLTITLFVLKLNNQGEFVFAKKLGSGNNYGMCLDNSGNIYTTGNFNSSSDFDPDSSVFNLNRTGANGIYISKLNANGNFLWAKSFKGNNSGMGFDIFVDDSNNVYSTGTFRGVSYFNPNNQNDSTISAGNTDVYALKLDSNGNFIWVNKIGGSGGDNAKSILTDKNNNLLLLGSFNNIVDFDPRIGIQNRTAKSNGNDIFLLQLKSNGQFVNVKIIGGVGSENGNDLTIDNQNSIIITGNLSSIKPDFDSIPGKYFLNVKGSEDLFIAKYSNCNLELIKSPENRTITNGSSTFFVVGSSSSTSNYQWQYLSKNGFENLQNDTQFIGVLNDTLFINNATQNLNNYKLRCIIYNDGCSVISDTASLKVECGYKITNQPTSKIVSNDKSALFSISIDNAFVDFQWQQKIGNSFINVMNNEQFLGSNNDSLTINNVNLNQNNSSFRCLTSLNNCKLISDTVTLSVRCEKLIKTQPVSRAINPGGSIIYYINTFSTTALFQWQMGGTASGDYFTSLSPSPFIKGVNDDSLIVSNRYPLQNNKEIFRCIVTDKGCIDTSNKVLVYFVGTNELQTNNLKVFPNPTSDFINVEFSNFANEVKYRLTDISGLEVLTGVLDNSKTTINISNLNNGMYFLTMYNDAMIIYKIIKQ